MKDLRYDPTLQLTYNPEAEQRVNDFNVDEVSIVYVGRHGASPEDLDNQFCGWTNSPLTHTGQEQVQNEANYLADKPFDVIYSSDLERALDSAKIIAAPKNRKVIATRLLRTWGIGTDLSGQNKTPMLVNLKKFYVKNPDMVPTGDDAESVNQSASRQLSGLAWVIANTPPGKSSCAVGHSSLFKIIGKTFGNQKLHVGPGGLIRLVVSPSGVTAEVIISGMKEADENVPDAQPAGTRFSSNVIETRAAVRANAPKPLKVLAICCSLGDPEDSASRGLAVDLLDAMRDLSPLDTQITDIVELNVPPGTKRDMGAGDDWPQVADAIEAAEVVVFVTPIWWNCRSSLMQRVIERMDSYTTKEGYGNLQGKVAGIVIAGAEDGGQCVQAGLMEPLSYFGFTLPPYCGFYQLGDNDDRTESQIKGTAKGLVQAALALRK